MRTSTIAIFLVLIAALLQGCFMPSAVGVGMPLVVSQPTPTALPEKFYVQAPVDATPTATPFQPLPPTEAYLPTETPMPTVTPLPTPTPTLTVAPPPEQEQQAIVNQPRRQINMLLLGSDQRPGDSNFRTDTIILATLNTELGTVNLTSFPRDLYITIPGMGLQRINTAWTFGGYKLLYDTFEYNFGVRPDHYVLINFSSFKRVIDSLGGLDINVGADVADYRGGRWFTIPAGPTHMDADTVLWYVRTRKTTNDFARTRRQQEVIQGIADKMLTLDAIKRAPEFYNIYKENVTTDINLGDILPLLPLAAKITDSSHINHYFIGPQQTYDWITYEGAMVLLPQPDAIAAVMRKALNAK